MELSMRINEKTAWLKVWGITEYRLTEHIFKFCEENKVESCLFKIEGKATRECKIEGLPAIFG